MAIVQDLISELESAGNQADALFLQGFFKTDPGEYGEGDRFLGVRVPQTRKIACRYAKDLKVEDLDVLLQSKWHEVRFAALVVMRSNFKKSDAEGQKAIFDLYLKHIGKGINNWDLVDVSCPNIVGTYLYKKGRRPLYDLAKGSLWQKRVSIISTFYFLREGDPSDTYKLAEILVNENHDLLQKAVGWSLREMGKLDDSLLYSFLDKYAATMPRTALRYSLEKVPTHKKNKYMQAKLKGGK
ncbi:MAG: DNA alkylation repair protein [Candidatus Saccharibacteria bacterium]